MISRVADNMTIQADNAVATNIRSDPVAVGNNNLARGVLVVHKLSPPASNGGQIEITPEYSNDGTYWVADTGGSVVTSTTGGDATVLSSQFKPETAYVRYIMNFDPAVSGSDTGIGYVTFDWVVRYSNQ